MYITDNHTMLTRFLNKEINEIYEKYDKITEEEESLIESFISKVEERVQIDLYLNYDKTKELAEVLEEESDIDLIRLYVFLRSELGLEVNLEEVRCNYKELESKGYTQIDSYLFYFDYGEEPMVAIVEEALEDDLEDADVVVDLFDEYEVANMFAFNTSKREAAKQYVQDNGWYDYLGAENLGVAYMDKYNCEVNYSLNEGSDIFE